MDEFSQKREGLTEIGHVFNPRFYTLGENGKPAEVKPEIIPAEEVYDFGNDLKERLSDEIFRRESNLDGKDGNMYWIYRILEEIVSRETIENKGPLPLAVEVGKKQDNFLGVDQLEDKESKIEEPSFLNTVKGIANIVDVNKLPVEMVNLTELRPAYVQANLERLSKVFEEGHRANLIYLSHVLTRDGVAADIGSWVNRKEKTNQDLLEDLEKEKNIIRELGKSLMPGGILVIDNNATGKNDLMGAHLNLDFLQDKKIGNFEVLLEHLGGLYVLRKKED
jgi:hypothetical protein